MFEIVLSREISDIELRQTLLLLVPTAIVKSIHEYDFSKSTVSYDIKPTNDPEWPCCINIYTSLIPLSLETGPIELAEILFREFSINSIIDTCGIVSGIDPQDPFWCLAHIDGGWHFADTCGMPLDGPYTDGKNEITGWNDISLLHPLDLTNRVNKKYSISDLGVNRIESDRK